MKLKAIVLMAVAVLLAVAATPAYADDIPPLPHAFYGTVEINNSPAPVGTEVEARGGGARTSIEGNPIVTTDVGKYGGPDGLDPKLVVQGDIIDGATITFYVNDEPTGQTAEWHSGEVTELDLSVTIAAPPGPGPAPLRYYIDTNLFGIEVSFRISDEGEILRTIEVTSQDGMLTITILEGTIALDEDGNPLESLEAAVDESPPDPPEGSYIIELAYNFGPDGATFDPPITFTWSYDPDEIPEDVAEEDLVIAYYDEEWVEIDCVVDTENNTITAEVSHFTTFAIITVPVVAPPAPAAFTVSSLGVSPSELAPSEEVNISVLVANTGGESGSYTVVLKINDVKEAEKKVTVAAGESQDVSFSVAREEAGSYSVVVDGLSASFTVLAPVLPPTPAPPEEEIVPVPEEVVPPEEEVVPVPAKPINWPVIGGVIGGVIVVGLLIFFLVRRRRALTRMGG